MTTKQVRLCGVRVPAGVYATTPTSTRGVEVEKFLIDPPIYEVKIPGEKKPMPVVDAFGVSPVGVTLWRDKAGTWHLLDWVGSHSYPNVADPIEEVRFMGLSRRVPVTLDFGLLGEKSRIFLFHSRGHVLNAANWLLDESLDDADWHGHGACVKDLAQHRPQHSLHWCARHFWQDVWGGEQVEDDSRRVTRSMPAGSYQALMPPDDAEAEYAPAMFASFPIVNLEVIKSDDGRDADALQAASAAGIEAYTVPQ
jgi:hypothetical protein